MKTKYPQPTPQHAPQPDPPVPPEPMPNNIILAQPDNLITTQDDSNGNGSPFQHLQHPKKRAFLELYAQVGQIGKCAVMAGFERTAHWYWLQHDPQYAEAWKLAEEMFAGALEDEAVRRGVEGVEDPVYQGKELVGHIRRFSDLLLIFRTKGALPKKYADRVSIDIEDRVRQVAQELGVNPDEAVLEAQKLLGSGKGR